MLMRRPLDRPWRRKLLVVAVIFVIALLTKGLWSASPSDLNSMKAEVASGHVSTLVEAQSGVPANGYISKNKCYVVIGQGGLSVQQNCKSWHLVPTQVRKTVGSCLVGVGTAWFTGGTTLAMGCFIAALGTIPW